jgi:AcrR family transcriptional regulator
VTAARIPDHAAPGRGESPGDHGSESGSPDGREPRRGRGGRRAGDSGTREAIQDAARAQFAERGYHGATIRAIAAVAEVDPALVHHFYGTKEALFAAAMRLPVVPSEVLTAALAREAWKTGGGDPVAGLGEHMVRTALGLWESDQLRETFIGLLRSAVTSEQAAVMLREFIADSILSTVARAAGLHERGSRAEAEFRAAMVATQMLGLALTRLVLALPPIAAASVDDLAVTVGPTIERYLTGEIQIPKRRARQRPRQGRSGR